MPPFDPAAYVRDLNMAAQMQRTQMVNDAIQRYNLIQNPTPDATTATAVPAQAAPTYSNDRNTWRPGHWGNWKRWGHGGGHGGHGGNWGGGWAKYGWRGC